MILWWKMQFPSKILYERACTVDRKRKVEPKEMVEGCLQKSMYRPSQGYLTYLWTGDFGALRCCHVWKLCAPERRGSYGWPHHLTLWFPELTSLGHSAYPNDVTRWWPPVFGIAGRIRYLGDKLWSPISDMQYHWVHRGLENTREIMYFHLDLLSNF